MVTYEITQSQMAELSKILQDLNNLNAVFSGQRGSGFMQDTAARLYGLLQRIEMQDIEPVHESFQSMFEPTGRK